MDKFIDNATDYFTKVTETDTYRAVNIIEYHDGEYVVTNPISQENIEAMRENMSEEDQVAFDDFCDTYFSGLSTAGNSRRIIE